MVVIQIVLIEGSKAADFEAAMKSVVTTTQVFQASISIQRLSRSFGTKYKLFFKTNLKLIFLES